ncbi:unnamed protein product [Amoebophrya sp. A25]|nr:unnamed protein product [Amoebophrya sp. A25]|eukprot:GSA25T00026815001.1
MDTSRIVKSGKASGGKASAAKAAAVNASPAKAGSQHGAAVASSSSPAPAGGKSSVAKRASHAGDGGAGPVSSGKRASRTSSSSEDKGGKRQSKGGDEHGKNVFSSSSDDGTNQKMQSPNAKMQRSGSRPSKMAKIESNTNVEDVVHQTSKVEEAINASRVFEQEGSQQQHQDQGNRQETTNLNVHQHVVESPPASQRTRMSSPPAGLPCSNLKHQLAASADKATSASSSVKSSVEKGQRRAARFSFAKDEQDSVRAGLLSERFPFDSRQLMVHFLDAVAKSDDPALDRFSALLRDGVDACEQEILRRVEVKEAEVTHLEHVLKEDLRLERHRAEEELAEAVIAGRQLQEKVKDAESILEDWRKSAYENKRKAGEVAERVTGLKIQREQFDVVYADFKRLRESPKDRAMADSWAACFRALFTMDSSSGAASSSTDSLASESADTERRGAIVQTLRKIVPNEQSLVSAAQAALGKNNGGDFDTETLDEVAEIFKRYSSSLFRDIAEGEHQAGELSVEERLIATRVEAEKKALSAASDVHSKWEIVVTKKRSTLYRIEDRIRVQERSLAQKRAELESGLRMDLLAFRKTVKLALSRLLLKRRTSLC